ncbi:fluoride efflux transporter CrcB [Halocatena marina]|uniref:Fluoride-specific ion channel FluC n=1 Tax=Halocatena marina TaxID=2934937 RepID=A0ABD5YW52_9EURY|nr:fluoride efflux transporter CrcB [Halocatena marina]
MTTIEPAHIVGTGGALGALLRYAVSEWIDTERFPAGTLIVNVVGSFVLAILTLTSASEQLLLLLGTGACGSFTTFSSFSYETIRLWESDDRTHAVLNAVGNLTGAGVAIGFAWILVHFVW